MVKRRRDTHDLSAEASESMENGQYLEEFTSDARGKSSEVSVPYLIHDLTRNIHDSAGGASHTSGVSSHNLTSEVACVPSQGASPQLLD